MSTRCTRRSIGSWHGKRPFNTRGLKTELVLASTLGASMTAQAALVFGWPIPSFLLWSVIAAAGAATVLSFAILSEYFPKEMSGRANAALNLLHVGAAFVLQSATGLIIEQWPEARGTYPAEAHQLAMGASIVPATGRVRLVRFAATTRAGTSHGASRKSISERSLRMAGDSDDTLHNGRAGVDTACRACQQASRGLAVRRGRIGGALHRPGGSSFHDDQPSRSRCPYLRGRSRGSTFRPATVARALRP